MTIWEIYISVPFGLQKKRFLFPLNLQKGKDVGAFRPWLWSWGTSYIKRSENLREIIYVSVYHKAYAVSTEGKVLWEVPTGLQEPKRGSRHRAYHCYGLNYLKKFDALVGLMGDGHLIVLDRATGKKLLKRPLLLPGSPSAPLLDRKKGPPEWIKDRPIKFFILWPQGVYKKAF